MKIQAFGKSFFWTSIVTLIGIFQILILLLVSAITNIVDVSSEYLFDSGIFIFYCIAISGSVLLDYFFLEKKGNINKLLKFLLFAIPVIILFTGAFSYNYLIPEVRKVFEDKGNFNIDILYLSQKLIIVLSFLYALGLKAVVFYYSKKYSSNFQYENI